MTPSLVTIITILVIILLTLNSIFVVFGIYKKFGIEVKRKKNVVKSEFTKELKLSEILSSVLVVALLAIGLSAKEVAPESKFVLLIEEYGLWVYIAWCIIIPIIFSLLFSFIDLRVRKQNKGE